MKRLIVVSDSDSNGGDNCTSSSDSNGGRIQLRRRPEGQRPGEEVVIPAPLLLNVYIVFSCRSL